MQTQRKYSQDPEQAQAQRTAAARRTLHPLVTLSCDLLVIALLAYGIIFWNLGAHSLAVSDEVYEVGAAQEMALTGDWLTPRVQGRPFFDKPPFKMWLTNLTVSLFGPSNFSYRLLDAGFGIGTLLLTYALARMLFASRAIGMFAVFSFLSCRIFVIEHGMRHAVQDSLLVFLCTAVLVCAWNLERALRAQRTGASPWLWACGCGICGGLAFLTKSAAAAMPFIAFASYLLISGRFLWFVRNGWKYLLLGGGLLTSLASSYFAWHCTVTPGACNQMLYYHVYKRFSSGVHNSISGPEFFLLRIFRDRAAFVPELLTIALLFGCYRLYKKRDMRFAFLLSAGVAPLVLYSAASTKFSWYIAPAFPFLAILIAALVVPAAQQSLRALKTGRIAHAHSLSMLILALVALVATTQAYAKNLQLIAQRTSRISLDLLTEDIYTFNQRTGRAPRILSYQHPRFAIDELNYTNLLRPWTETIEETELSQVLQGEPPDFILTGIHHIPQFAKNWPITHLMMLKPIRNRNTWVVALAFTEGAVFDHLQATKQLIKFGEPDFEAMHGLGGPERFNHLKVRFMLGDSAALRVEGSAITELVGAKLLVNIAPQLGTHKDPLVLQAAVNQVSLAPLALAPGQLATYQLHIPPGALRAGENVLFLTVTRAGTTLRATDRPVMLNWASLSLPDQ